MAENERLKAWLEEGRALVKDGVFADFSVTFRTHTGAFLELVAPVMDEAGKLQMEGYTQAVERKRRNDV